MATKDELRGLVLSATELKNMTDWPEALIEDYLNILNNFITLADEIDEGALPQDLDTDASPTFAGLAQIGTSTNKFVVASDGEWRLYGTARVEKILESMTISGRGASAPTERTTESPYLSYTFNINNDVHQTFEAPYAMDYDYESYIKVHWYTSVDQTDDEVNWQAEWNACSEDGGDPVNAGSTTDTSGDINCPTQWEIQETLIETIPASSISEGDIVGIDVTRIAIVDGTDPALNSIHVLSVEFEYISNRYGKAI